MVDSFWCLFGRFESKSKNFLGLSHLYDFTEYFSILWFGREMIIEMRFKKGFRLIVYMTTGMRWNVWYCSSYGCMQERRGNSFKNEYSRWLLTYHFLPNEVTELIRQFRRKFRELCCTNLETLSKINIADGYWHIIFFQIRFLNFLGIFEENSQNYVVQIIQN